MVYSPVNSNGFGPIRLSSFNWSNFSICSAVNLKSKTFKFSSILDGVTDFGITTTPWSIFHLITT